MNRLDTLARRAASELQSEVKSMPVPRLDVDRIRERQVRRTIRTSVLAVAVVVVVVGVPIWLGSFAPEEPVAPSTTLPGPVTTIPDMQEEGMLKVETSLGTWQWVRGEEPGLGLPDDPTWVELPDPPVPAIEQMVWPQIESVIGPVGGTGPVSGYPVSVGDVTITPADVRGHIDWNLFYTNTDGWVEGRWQPLDGDCPRPEVCPTQTATLEILAVSEESDGGGVSYPVGGVLDVLVASIIPGDPRAVEFRDEETGDLVLRVEANEDVTAEQLIRAGQACAGGLECGGGMHIWELHVEGVGWVDPPWHGMDLVAWTGVDAGARDDGFWIVGIEGSWLASTLHAWGSSDGVNWEEIAIPFPLADSLANGLQQMDVAGGDLVILTPASGPETPAPPSVLRLVDGEFAEFEVDLTPLGFNEGAEISDFSTAPWGWVATTWAQTCRLWVSPNGKDWEEITTPDGTDTAETVNVQSWTFNEDGTGVAEGPGVPTPAESVPARVAGSGCSLTDDGVYLEFEHLINGSGTVHEGESYPDFYYTSWLGGFVEEDGQDN